MNPFFASVAWGGEGGMTEPISLRRRNLLSLPSSSHLARSRREEEGGVKVDNEIFRDEAHMHLYTPPFPNKSDCAFLEREGTTVKIFPRKTQWWEFMSFLSSKKA